MIYNRKIKLKSFYDIEVIMSRNYQDTGIVIIQAIVDNVFTNAKLGGVLREYGTLVFTEGDYMRKVRRRVPLPIQTIPAVVEEEVTVPNPTPPSAYGIIRNPKYDIKTLKEKLDERIRKERLGAKIEDLYEIPWSELNSAEKDRIASIFSRRASSF
jgi:hypothetical protein